MDVSFDVVPTENGRLKLTPREAQPVGATLRLETQPSPHCWLDAPLDEEYVVVAPQSPPSSLGTLEADVQRGPLPLGVNADRTCWAFVDAVYADVGVKLDASAAPFANRLVYSLFVDGQQFAPYEPFMHPQAKPWSLNGYARIYTTCGVPAAHGAGLTPGKHTVRMEATLDALTLSTAAIEVDLHCAESPARPDAGPDDAGAPATPSVDAGATPTSDAIADDAPEGVAEASDTGCRVATSGAYDGAVWIAVVWLWRRRRSSQRLAASGGRGRTHA